MFSKISALLLLLLVVSPAVFAVSVKHIETRRIEGTKSVAVPHATDDSDICPICVSFMGQATNELINIILNAGVLGGCSDLCGQLSNQVEATVCDLLCSYVGVDEFIKIIDDADPDPIFYCEELDLCPKSSTANATINSVDVTPKEGHKNGVFNITAIFTVTSETGTGEVGLAILPPFPGEPFGTGELIESLEPSTYEMVFNRSEEHTSELQSPA